MFDAAPLHLAEYKSGVQRVLLCRSCHCCVTALYLAKHVIDQRCGPVFWPQISATLKYQLMQHISHNGHNSQSVHQLC